MNIKIKKLVQNGIPLLLTGVCIYLLWKSEKKASTPRTHLLSRSTMIKSARWRGHPFSLHRQFQPFSQALDVSLLGSETSKALKNGQLVSIQEPKRNKTGHTSKSRTFTLLNKTNLQLNLKEHGLKTDNSITRSILPQELSSFQTATTYSERQLMVELFEGVTGLLRHHNITYHLHHGTLNGAYRHAGIIPWDDDMDIAVNIEQRSKVKILLANNNSYFLENQDSLHQQYTIDKVYFKVSNRSSTFQLNMNSSWPFIDIFYYKLDKAGMRQICSEQGECSSWIFNASRIFPLRLIPFEGRPQPVPSDNDYVLSLRSETDVRQQCCSKQRHLRPMKDFESKCVPCTKLHKYFRFVNINPI